MIINILCKLLIWRVKHRIFRRFFRTGANIYSDSEDVILSGGGILTVHTLTGGQRSIKLKNGKIVNIELPKNLPHYFIQKLVRY